MSRVAEPGEVQTTVSALIISRESTPRLVLHKHKRYGVWMQPGGHVDPGESSIETLVREVFEETGIDISEQFSPTVLRPGVRALPTPNWMFSYDIQIAGEPDHIHVDHLYLVRVPYQPLSPASTESPEIDWWTVQDLRSLQLFPGNAEFFSSVLKGEEQG